MALINAKLCPDPPPVSDLTIQVIDDDAHLSWTRVQCGEAYLVHFAEDTDGPFWYLGISTDSTFVHPTVAFFASDMFYFVEAYCGAIPELTELTANYEPGTLSRKQLFQMLNRR